MASTMEVATALVALMKVGKADEAIKTWYAADVVSVEASGPPGQSRELTGIEAVLGKSAWWADNHEVHSAKVEGPWPHDDKFILHLTYEVTFKPESKRFVMEEAALYWVKDGKIAREEFFYSM